MPVCAHCGAESAECRCPKPAGFAAQLGAVVLVSAAVLGIAWLLSLLALHAGLTALGKGQAEAFTAYRQGVSGLLPMLAMAHACLAQHVPLTLAGEFIAPDNALRLTGGLALPMSAFSVFLALLLWAGGCLLAAWTRPTSAGQAWRLALCYAIAYAALLTLGAACTVVPLRTLLTGLPTQNEVAAFVVSVFTVDGSTLTAAFKPALPAALALGLLWPLLFGGLGIAGWRFGALRRTGSAAGYGFRWLHSLVLSGRMTVAGLAIGAVGAALTLKHVAKPLLLLLAPALGGQAFGLLCGNAPHVTQELPDVTTGGAVITTLVASLWQGLVKTEGDVITRTALPAWAWALVLAPLLLHLGGGVCLARRDRAAGRQTRPAWLALRYALCAAGWLALAVWVAGGGASLVFSLIGAAPEGAPTSQAVMAVLAPGWPTLIGGSAALAFLGSLVGAAMGARKATA